MTLVFDVVVGPMFTGFVFYDSLFTIGLQKCVNSFGVIMVPGFPLTLNVVVFQIMNGIVVVIVWWSLNTKNYLIFLLVSLILPGSQCILLSGALLHLAHTLLPLRLRLEELHSAKQLGE